MPHVRHHTNHTCGSCRLQYNDIALERVRATSEMNKRDGMCDDNVSLCSRIFLR